MSHFSSIKTKITRKQSLVRALETINKSWKGNIEVHETPQNLYGYHGDRREQTAEIIIRRKYIGGSSNDIGFVKQEDGTYAAIISDFDSSTYSKSWLEKLTMEYAAATVKDTADDYGWTWTEQRTKDEIWVTCENNY